MYFFLKSNVQTRVFGAYFIVFIARILVDGLVKKYSYMLEYTIYSYNFIILIHRSLVKKPHMLSIFSKQTLSWPKYSMHVIVLCQNLTCRPIGHGTH